ncbi:heparin lyase I family protein [Kitasatospora sp. NPDC059327]|uniref:heparin lyase I family protein n=1 Tax=Kitasatospora sp. NPDC059327 TaxID=3346803 RepID=UPI0036BA2F3B
MFQRHSRVRRAGALLAAVLAVGAASVGSTATAASTTVPFSDGFESGDTAVWPRRGIDGAGTVDVVAAPGGHAGKAARFTMPDSGNSYRSEIATSRLPYGSYRYTFANYLPQEWIPFEAQTIVSQWHGGTDTIPAVVLAVRADRWMMLVHWKSGSEPVNEVRYDLGPVRLGHWNQWAFDITWSTATTPGSITARLDGAQVGSHQGPNSYGQDTAPYHKIGLYRPNWKASKGYVNRGTAPVVVYYDDVSITPSSPVPGKPTAAPSSAAPSSPTAPSPAATASATPGSPTSPKPATTPPTARPSASESAQQPPSAQPSAPATASGPAVPGSTSGATPGATPGPVNEIPAETDTDTDNDGRPLAETGASSRTPLVLATGGALLVAGLLLAYRLRRRNATGRTHRRA